MRKKCLVIMPFGVKPFAEGERQTFDCDKVYRVLIKRAIESAGMEAIRADEKTDSRIIHSDMFKDLRDRSVVIADLSLNNPNVYYELGVRHVLSPAGTVLICREGAELPFDVRLSRVVFYKYNGVDLDWEEVENVVPRLKAALETAKDQKPDSPVHALLERVTPRGRGSAPRGGAGAGPGAGSAPGLRTYQKLVADIWRKQKDDIDELLEQHRKNKFGARAVGELCLMSDPLPLASLQAARVLYDHGQYGLACAIFKKIRELENAPDAGTDAANAIRLSPNDYVYFGSAISEKKLTVQGADDGVEIIREGLDRMGDDTDAVDLFRLYNGLGGVLSWKWRLEKRAEVFDESIENLKRAKKHADSLISGDAAFPAARVAKLFLRLLVLTRQREGMVERKDVEGYRDAVLGLDESKAMDVREASYLRWYKAIALADAGNKESAHDMVVQAIKKDAVLQKDQNEYTVEIGNIQYTRLRRFIEDNSKFLRNHDLLGHISQMLQNAGR